MTAHYLYRYRIPANVKLNYIWKEKLQLLLYGMIHKRSRKFIGKKSSGNQAYINSTRKSIVMACKMQCEHFPGNSSYPHFRCSLANAANRNRMLSLFLYSIVHKFAYAEQSWNIKTSNTRSCNTQLSPKHSVILSTKCHVMYSCRAILPFFFPHPLPLIFLPLSSHS